MDENDLVDENYEEDQTCLVPFWLDSNGFCYIPCPLDGVVDIPEEVLDDQEVLNTMPISTETKEQDTQADEWTQDKGVNTNESWQHLMQALVEQNAELEATFKSLQKQKDAEEVESQNRVKSLEKIRDDKQRQHRALLEKIESVRVKLDLNSSKTTRKNFSAKVDELTAERDQKLETKRRLTQDLEVVDMKLKSLKEEQRNEKSAWDQEITGLQHEMDKLSSQVEESNQAALKDEIAALESERELAVSQSEDWIAEAERYLNTLRSDTSPQTRWPRIEWEKNVAEARQNLSTLQSRYNKNIKMLLGGQQLDNLPKIPLPQFPHIPMLAVSRPPVPLPQFPSAHISTPPPQSPASFMPHMLEQTVPVPRPAVPATVHALSLPYTPPTYQFTPVPPAQVGVPTGLPAAVKAMVSGQSSASQALPSSPKPVGKLDKLLEKLGTQFPKCTRNEIMVVLQQVKSERGTMGGMSVEDIILQVEQKLAQNERLPLGPIAPPAGSQHSHRGPVQPALPTHPSLRAPSPHVFQSRGPQAAPSVRKLCLMCQNHVEPGTQYNTNCSHTLHKECISVWLQSSKNNSCPFCPSK